MQDPFFELERMHDTETVRRETIIAWYNLYARKLPPRQPARSDVDLIRTIALWMSLTDAGGSPGFPHEYKSDIDFSEIDVEEPARVSISYWVGVICLVAGLVTLAINWQIGLPLAALGPLIVYASYKLNGGASNPNLMKEGSSLYRYEGRRVLEWATQSGEGDTEE